MAQKQPEFFSVAGLLFFVAFIAVGLVINNPSLPLSYNIAFGNTSGSGSGGGGGGGGGGGYGGTSSPLISSFRVGYATASEVRLDWTGNNYQKAVISYATGAKVAYIKLAEFDPYLTSYTHKAVDKNTRYKYKLELINTLFTTTAESIIEVIPSQYIVGATTAAPLAQTQIAAQPKTIQTTAPANLPDQFLLPICKGDARTDAVKQLQEWLMALSWNKAAQELREYGATGFYGPLTQNAVAETQDTLARDQKGLAAQELAQTLTIVEKGVCFGEKTYNAEVEWLLEKPLQPTPAKIEVPNPIIKYGDSGDEVTTLQNVIIQLSLGPAAKKLASIGATGKCLQLTTEAIAEMQNVIKQGSGQTAHYLATVLEIAKPGIYGPATASALTEYLAAIKQ